MEFQGFPRIHGIFYAVFDIIKGTVVKHQVPEGSITLQQQQEHQPLIDFEAISEYIIPKNQLYKRLVTISTGNYKVMGCPVVLHDHEKYRHLRNEFRFNLCFIFDDQAETTSYEAVVRKLSRVLEGLELECDFLSQDVESKTVQNVIEQLYEDLNSYCECQIPINTFNTINLKLFPSYPNPPPVYDYQVPVTTLDVNKMMNSNWDITVQKVAKHINGINHVKKISELTNVKPEWTKICMEHLLYYGCIVMTDIFQFGNVYAIQPELTRLLDEKSGLGRECLEYITLPGATVPLLSRVFALYSGLQYGISVKDWMEENQLNTLPIDIRRFISFGVIKGFIYRVHKYPILVNCHQQQEGRSVFPTVEQQQSLINRNTGMGIYPELFQYLDGQHHYDEICTQLKCSPQELDEHLGYQTKELPLFDTTNKDEWCVRFIER
ncbi:nitrogen permease regulator 2 [Halteromyces radiatus]|uniref:nitrogen permease regulator 2 n=1 Tax=Halteromyces radiatus TaxID=101107 RepID=UPI00221FEBB9|nr:nitrogen permease regulator 2 [Halteromyces radiatus]KAI8093850.1 nitrogen permease regulator 2 [Halteromyces radiatus]